MAVPQKRLLFRQEVIEFQRQNRQWGRVVPLQPWPVRLTFYLVTLSIIAIVAFLALGHYARKETVTGYLAPAAGTARVFAARGGTVTGVHVRQGELVQEGQPLFTLAVEQIAADNKDVDASILATLERQGESLGRQIAAEERRGEAERRRLTAQIANYQAQLGQMAAQVAIQGERIKVAEKILNSGAQLVSRGLVSEIDQRRREENLLEQTQHLSGMAEDKTKLQDQMDEAKFNLEVLPTVTADKLQKLRGDLAATEQRIDEVNGRRAYIVRAPLSGRVAMLQATLGEVADPKRLLAQITPGDSPLRAELFVPVRAIGFMHPGQDVRIQYDAFPYQHYGTYKARIVSISQTIVTANDVVGPVAPKDPAYRAIAALERPDIDAYGKHIPLQTDMSLKAEVILERRTLVEWILDPLRRARG